MLSLSFLVHELTLSTPVLHKSQARHQCNLRYIWIRRITKIESRSQAPIHPRLSSKSLVRPTTLEKSWFCPCGPFAQG